MPDRPQNITFVELRESGVRGLLVYCVDCRCSSDDLRLPDIEPRFSDLE